MAVSVAVASFGVLLAYLMYRRESHVARYLCNLAGGSAYRLFDRKWYFDEIYQAVFVNGTLLLARFWSAFDAYIIDGIVNGAAALTRFVVLAQRAVRHLHHRRSWSMRSADVTFWLGNTIPPVTDRQHQRLSLRHSDRDGGRRCSSKSDTGADSSGSNVEDGKHSHLHDVYSRWRGGGRF